MTTWATDHGVVEKLSDNAFITAIEILKMNELSGHGDDGELEDFEIETANEIVTMVAYLENELRKRQERRFKAAVWKDAATKGYDKRNPAHRAAVAAHIKGCLDAAD